MASGGGFSPVVAMPSGTVPLHDVQDVFGMCGRRKGATESRILQGRDALSVRVLVPDCRGLEQNFHDITVVDMGDLPESEVSIPELSDLTRKWPPAVDLAQLWRCPVAWCTVWKGALQDLTDHVRYTRRVPEEVQSVRLDKFIPPWTVTQKIYTE